MDQKVDYYRILQVHYGAKKADIIASYRRLCKLYHPDVNSRPEAEEQMKQINLAYAALCGETAGESPFVVNRQRASANATVNARRALECIRSYFSALLASDYIRAYSLLSEYDKKYVTLQSFCEWRKSVQKLFAMREFSVRTGSHVFMNKLKDGTSVPAVKHFVSITEKNTMLQTVDSYQVSKLAILEPGGWHVFLGYRDLNEIAKIFENLSIEQEKGEIARHWEEYCSNTCRELNMLSLNGLLREASRELYRYKRYKQYMTVACFRVRPISAHASDELISDIAETASKTIIESLRETDIPAYMGQGVFAVLFIELRKRNAQLITQRITNKLKSSVHKQLRLSIYAECSFEAYEGGDIRDYISRCSRNF